MRPCSFRLLFGLTLMLLAALPAARSSEALADSLSSREKSALKTVGQIVFDLPEGHAAGTAFQVGYCTVLTNFHVAFGPWYVTALRPPSSAAAGVFELTGITLPDGSHPTTRAVPVAWGDYTGPDRQYRKPMEDWVLLATEDCLGAVYGFLTANDPRFDDGVGDEGAYSSIGYSSGVQMVDRSCSIFPDAGDGTFYHNCASMPGDSGAPIIRPESGRVVAITSGYRAGGKQGCGSSHGGDGAGKKGAPCSNTAVPLSHELTEQVSPIDAAAVTQMALRKLGYSAGVLGAFDRPEFAGAIRQAQSDMGLAVTGQPSFGLAKMLVLRRLGVFVTSDSRNMARQH